VESDLRRLFQITPGFLNLKMYYGKDTAPVCFVEYTDIQSSSRAMESMQGIPFGPTRLRIEYARRRMGETNSSSLSIMGDTMSNLGFYSLTESSNLEIQNLLGDEEEEEGRPVEFHNLLPKGGEDYF